MEPLFGPKGTMIGWLKGDVIYNMNLRPFAFVRDGGFLRTKAVGLESSIRLHPGASRE